jgi:hypothetical protein
LVLAKVIALRASDGQSGHIPELTGARKAVTAWV